MILEFVFKLKSGPEFGQGLWIAASNIRLKINLFTETVPKPTDKSELQVLKYSLQVRLQFQKEALK